MKSLYSLSLRLRKGANVSTFIVRRVQSLGAVSFFSPFLSLRWRAAR